MSDTTAPLRASCDRCRSLKLRCVPSSDHAPGPCQRCLRAKISESCVFSQRSRAGRAAKSVSGGGGSSHGRVASKSGLSTPRKNKDSWLPGTSTFVLTTNINARSDSPPESASSETSHSSSATHSVPSPAAPPLDPQQLSTLHSEDALTDAALGGAALLGPGLLTPWEQDTDGFFPDLALPTPQPEHYLPFAEEDAAALPDALATSEPGDILSITAPMELEADLPLDLGPPAQHAATQECHIPGLMTPFDDSNTTTAVIPSAIDVNCFPGLGTPGPPLVNLTAFLAEMSRYEIRLSKFCPSGNTVSLEDYPIGDAIFLSQRFYAIITDYTGGTSDPGSVVASTIGSSDPAGSDKKALGEVASPYPLDMLLPTLTGYRTLVRIYSTIFRFLLDHLSSVRVAHTGHLLSHQGHGFLQPLMANIHAYRGLRLGQLQGVYFCAGRDLASRVKNAICILLSGLGGAESALGLPPELRVVRKGHGGAGAARQGEGGGELDASVKPARIVLPFEESGSVYEAFREQARDLRERVEELNGLLKEIL